MAVPVKLDGSVEIGSATALFQTEITVGSPNRYAVTADGQRFLINSPAPVGPGVAVQRDPELDLDAEEMKMGFWP